MASISIDLVRSAEGSVDVEATLFKAHEQILEYIAKRETEEAEIGKAVHAVFDQYPGASINMPAITSLVLRSLGAEPANFKTLTEKVVEYLRNNSGEKGMAQFQIARGRNGGVKRWCDQP